MQCQLSDCEISAFAGVLRVQRALSLLFDMIQFHPLVYAEIECKIELVALELPTMYAIFEHLSNVTCRIYQITIRFPLSVTIDRGHTVATTAEFNRNCQGIEK